LAIHHVFKDQRIAGMILCSLELEPRCNLSEFSDYLTNEIAKNSANFVIHLNDAVFNNGVLASHGLFNIVDIFV
jgi:hypothetical protein